MLRLIYLLLFANYFLGGPEVLDLQFRNAQKEPYTLCLKKGPSWNTLELCQILSDFQNFCTAGKRIKFPAKCMHATLPTSP